jgi:ATP-binding cassette subfamily C protein
MKLIREVWYIFGPRERIEGAFLLCAMAIGAMFEAVNVGLVVPFIAVVKDPQFVFQLPVAQPVLAALNIHEPQGLLVAMGLVLIGAFLVKSGYLLLLYRWLFRYVFAKHVTLARRLPGGYLGAPYTFHRQRNSAELIKVGTDSIQRFSAGFLVALLVVLGEAWVVVAMVALLMVIEPLATFAGVLVLGLTSALVYRSMQRRLAAAGRVAEQSMASMIQWTEQAIGGIKETLLMDRASFFIDRHGDQRCHLLNN